jgi:FKBP-type peptidyl-prolyl cis-trans isomerase SlyD
MTEPTVAANKVVSVTYSIIDESGEVLEQSDLPVDYLHGSENGLFMKVEEALEGKAAGDSVEVTLTPEEGFGQRDPTLTYSDKIENVPPEYRKLGAEAEFRNEQGGSIKMVVTHVDNGTITLDGNHPFAGKSLTFHVKIVGVRDATAEELESGVNPQQRPTLH